VKYEAVCKTLVKISDRISTQVRTLALGVLAVLWAVWTSDSAATRTIGVHLRSHAVGIACVAVLTLLADFGQYAFGYRVSLDLRKKMEDEQLDSAEYDYSTRLYRWQNYLFFTKQAIAALYTIWLVLTLGIILATRR
jgi:hypothetical protein